MAVSMIWHYISLLGKNSKVMGDFYSLTWNDSNRLIRALITLLSNEGQCQMHGKLQRKAAMPSTAQCSIHCTVHVVATTHKRLWALWLMWLANWEVNFLFYLNKFKEPFVTAATILDSLGLKGDSGLVFKPSGFQTFFTGSDSLHNHCHSDLFETM